MYGFINAGSCPLSYRYNLHAHDEWVIIYYTRGEGINTIGGEPVPFRAGDIICVPPHIDHAEVSENGYENLFCMVDRMDHFGMDIPVFNDNSCLDYKQILLQMIRINQNKEYNWENITNAMLGVLSEYMSSWNHGKTKGSYVTICEKIIDENVSNSHFTLDKFYETIPISSTYFMKLFKKEKGYTPNQYLTLKRINRAKFLLAQKNAYGWRVKDVADMCGFHDPFYFSKVFKKITGHSPENIQ